MPRQPAPPEQGGFRDSGDVVGAPATKRDLLTTWMSAFSSVPRTDGGLDGETCWQEALSAATAGEPPLCQSI